MLKVLRSFETTLVGLITKGDETHYREEVNFLTKWYSDNLLLIISKTKEIVVDFCKSHTDHPSLTIDGAVVERERAAPNSCRCTSARTSPGLPTPLHGD